MTRAGTSAIEAIFQFETADGRGSGVLRLTPDANDGNTLKAWTLLTSLDEIKGYEEQAGRSRPQGKAYSRDFRGPNWLDLRKAAAEYADRDPAVLVVGGGQAGLSIAARLTQLQVDTLIVDREARIGDNWRNRYHALVLHNQVHVNHLPYMPFPPSWPTYIPKDKLAAWFEAYVESMELNYWTGTEFEGGSYDEQEERWSVVLRRADGTKREMHPRHVVMATGVSGIPSLPDIPTLRNFGGTILHSSQYDDGEAWKGKNALVIGSGNSGHDIAQDLHSSGAKVTLVQRSSTMIVNVEPSAQLPYALYDEGPSLEDCDLITTSIPLALARKSHILLTEQAKNLDKELLDGLERRGFKLDFGEDGTGWQFKYLTRGGGYYFNVGCSDLIVEGEIGLAQFSDIAEFVAEGARMRNGETLAADLIVLATGYKGQEHLVRKLFGDDVAARVGPIWGFGDGPGVAQHVHAHRAAGPLVHRRQFRPMPHLLEVSRPADQGLRGRPAPPKSRPSGRLRLDWEGLESTAPASEGKALGDMSSASVRIVVMEGDGIGPEITAATLDVLRAAERVFALDLSFAPVAVGFAALRAHGSTLPDAAAQAASAADGVILGPVSHNDYPPVAQGGLNPSGELRRRLDLFANIRPARSRGGFPPRCGSPVDLVIARENTEGFYADRSMFLGSGEFMPTPDLALSVRKISRAGSTRIAEAAFALARRRRNKVTAVHKANVLRVSDGLFLECVRAVAARFPAVQYEERIMDAMAALLVRDAGAFDVIVTTNMFGDILSDLASEISGSLGLAASLNAGTAHAMAQAQHGSAPDLAGQDRANPASLIGSAAMLLAWLGERRDDGRFTRAAAAIEDALDRAIATPQWRTPDLGGPLGTKAFGARVAALVEEGARA